MWCHLLIDPFLYQFATRLKDTFWADLKVEAQKADYVVIGPVDEKIQMTTGTMPVIIRL